MPKLQHLVFDMGGVLVEIDWHGKMSKLLGRDIPFERIHALWEASPAVNDFEHGRSTFDDFANAFIQEHELELSVAEFQTEFLSIVKGEFEGVSAMLSKLSESFTISLLSNTNPAHWELVNRECSFFEFVDHPFTSLDFGMMKPAPKIYQSLLEKLNATAESVLFFDDGLANVEAARNEGLNAERVFGPDDIRTALSRYGISV